MIHCWILIPFWWRSSTAIRAASLIGYCYVRKSQCRPTINLRWSSPNFLLFLGAPGRPIIYSPSSTMMTADSFTLKWRRPAETGGDDDITYTVRYRMEKDQNRGTWIMKTITTKQLQLKITELENNVRYKFEVTAKNKGGESLPGERYIQTNFTRGKSV